MHECNYFESVSIVENEPPIPALGSKGSCCIGIKVKKGFKIASVMHDTEDGKVCLTIDPTEE